MSTKQVQKQEIVIHDFGKGLDHTVKAIEKDLSLRNSELIKKYDKEMVKIGITPMISSLSILNYVDMDSDELVLGYGISLIILNGLMYVGLPIIGIVVIRKRF